MEVFTPVLGVCCFVLWFLCPLFSCSAVVNWMLSVICWVLNSQVMEALWIHSDNSIKKFFYWIHQCILIVSFSYHFLIIFHHDILSTLTVMFFPWFNFLTSVSMNSFCSTQRYMQVMDDLNNRPVGDRFYSKKVATIATSVDKFQDRNTNSPPKSPRIEILEVAKANKVSISQK